MSDRIQGYRELHRHPYYKKQLSRMKSEEKQACCDFIVKNQDLSPAEWEKKVNRLFIGQAKPKNWALITEILSVIGPE